MILHGWEVLYFVVGLLSWKKWTLINSAKLIIFLTHDDVIKWKHFPRNWPFVREINRSPVNFPHKGQWRGALMFSLIYAWINDWVNNREAGDLRRQHGHYDVIVMNHTVVVVLMEQPYCMLTYDTQVTMSRKFDTNTFRDSFCVCAQPVKHIHKMISAL